MEALMFCAFGMALLCLALVVAGLAELAYQEETQEETQ